MQFGRPVNNSVTTGGPLGQRTVDSWIEITRVSMLRLCTLPRAGRATAGEQTEREREREIKMVGWRTGKLRIVTNRTAGRRYTNSRSVPMFVLHDPIAYCWLLSRFLPRYAMRKRGLCCRPVSVCPSVTLVDCIQTAKDIVKLLSRPGNPIILVFFVPSAGTQFQGEPPAGTQNTSWWKILRFSTEIAVYLGNGTR